MFAAVATIFGVLAQILNSSVVRFVALKILLTGLFVLLLPIVLNNLFHSILSEVIAVAQAHVDVGGSSMRYTLTGVGAYWGSLLRLPECLSILLSACACRLTLRIARLI